MQSNSITNLEQWADARNTSLDVARAIKDAARNRVDRAEHATAEDFNEAWSAAAQALWEAPTDDEVSLISEAALAASKDDVLDWGVTKITR